MDLDDLNQQLRDFFLSQYKTGTPATNSFLAFEPLGHMILPDDFKMNDQFIDEKAIDQLSLIADFVPPVTSYITPGSLNSISSTYGGLLASVQFYEGNITGSIDPYLNLYGKIKNEADNLYKSQASTIGTATSETFVSNGNLGGWYNPDSAIWQHKTVSTRPPAPDQPPQKPVLWKLNPIAVKLQQNAQLVHLLNKDAVVSRIKNLQLAGGLHSLVADESTKAAADSSTIARSAIRPSLQAERVGLSRAAPIAVTITADSVKDGTGPSPIQMLSSASFINKSAYDAIKTGLPLNKMIAVNRAIGDNSNATTRQTNSSSFSMDFYYSIVSLSRPWFDQQLINNAKIWFALTQKKGFYSTGANDASNTGALCAIPKAMIVIKDLNISAQWSASDKNNASMAYGFGSFNIANSSFNNNTLTAPGIQILGWICEVLPQLPANDDQNVT